MKKYETPEVELIRFTADEIVLTSSDIVLEEDELPIIKPY